MRAGCVWRLTGPLLRRAPIGAQRLLHHFALPAVRDASAGAREEAANLPVELALPRRGGGVAQTAS